MKYLKDYSCSSITTIVMLAYTFVTLTGVWKIFEILVKLNSYISNVLDNRIVKGKKSLVNRSFSTTKFSNSK